MKTEKWKYGYVRDLYIVVSNCPDHKFNVYGGHFLEDIEINIGNNGTLRITGNEIHYDFYLHKTSESSWREEPEESRIKTRKVGMFWKRREERYLQGWVRTKKRILTKQ